MEQQGQVRIVTLKDLWNLFIQKLGMMVVCSVVVMALMGIFNLITFTPVYKSTATLYILRQDQNGISGSSDDFSLALKVVGDCDYLLKSHSVLDTVIDDLNLDVSYEQLSHSITTNNPENTRVLEVSATGSTPMEAKKIVDKVCSVGSEKIREAMGFEQVNLYEYGTLNSKPDNKTGIVTYLLVGFIVAILVYTIYLVAFIMDDRIRTNEDIERYLGLSVLGEIPNANASHKGKYGYYGENKGNSKKGKKKGK